MRYLLALMFAALCLAPAPAMAQFGWGQTFDRNAFHYLPPAATGHWRACINDEQRYESDEVIEGCRRLLENRLNHEDRAMALWWRAVAHERADQADNAAADYQAALAAYTEWAESDNRLTLPYFYRASIYVHLKQYDNALAEYAAADRIMPRIATTYAGRGQVAFAQGDYARAITEFDQAGRLDRVTSFDHLRCEARAAAGTDLEVARRICDRAVRNSEGHPRTLFARGYFRFRQGDMDGATADFARALRSDPHYLLALYGRGVISVRAGRTAEGEADIARARQLDSHTIDYFAGAGLTP
jgi:tetratricopeptide (TPR) repeat protein